MIQVTLNNEKKESEKPFPKLMIMHGTHHSDGTIVLFEHSKRGVVIFGKGDYYNCVGEIWSTWDIDKFTDYNEPVTLQNK